MKITKVVNDNQLYVYFNGVLVYKRWMFPNTKFYGRVFHEQEGLTQYARKNKRN